MFVCSPCLVIWFLLMLFVLFKKRKIKASFCFWPAQVTSDLFDIMSGQTDVDHPLCEECTDTLLDHLDTQLNITENECQNYKWAGLSQQDIFRGCQRREAWPVNKVRIHLQAVSGASVQPAGGGRGDPAGRAAAAEKRGGDAGAGAGGRGGAAGCCGQRSGAEQDSGSAAGHRGAPVRRPRRGFYSRNEFCSQYFYQSQSSKL